MIIHTRQRVSCATNEMYRRVTTNETDSHEKQPRRHLSCLFSLKNCITQCATATKRRSKANCHTSSKIKSHKRRRSSSFHSILAFCFLLSSFSSLVCLPSSTLLVSTFVVTPSRSPLLVSLSFSFSLCALEQTLGFLQLFLFPGSLLVESWPVHA